MYYSQFLAKLLTLVILFSTTVKAVVVVVVNLVILGISFLTSFVLTFRIVLVANLVISGILSSIFLIWPLFKQNHFFYYG